MLRCQRLAWGAPWPRQPHACLWPAGPPNHVAANAAATAGAHRATAVGFVSVFSRLPVHPANTKANSRAMILIRAIPFCQVSKQGYAAKGNAIYHRNWRLEI